MTSNIPKNKHPKTASLTTPLNRLRGKSAWIRLDIARSAGRCMALVGAIPCSRRLANHSAHSKAPGQQAFGRRGGLPQMHSQGDPYQPGRTILQVLGKRACSAWIWRTTLKP